MYNELNILEAEARPTLGTGTARQLRKEGKIPATLYGSKQQQLFFSLSQKDITNLYRKGYFTSTVFLLKVGNESIKVLPKSIDLHPLTDLVINADFVYLNPEIQEVKIPILFDGKERAVGVKRGGFFNIIKRKVKVSCTKGNVPQYISIDVTEMRAGGSIRAKELTMPEGCKLLEDGNLVVASIIGKVSKEDAEAKS